MSNSGRSRLELLANVHCEEQFLGKAKLGVLAGASVVSVASLMAVFAQDGDRIWLAAHNSNQVEELQGLNCPLLENLDCEFYDDFNFGRAKKSRLLTWGPKASTSKRKLADIDFSGIQWWRELANLPRSSQSSGKKMNCRSTYLKFMTELGRQLPNSHWFETEKEFEQFYNRILFQSNFVLKAAYGASGRNRIRGGYEMWLNGFEEMKLLVRRSQGAILEPWMQRVRDFGACYWISKSGSFKRLSLHELILNPLSEFSGIRLFTDPSKSILEKESLIECEKHWTKLIHLAIANGYYGPLCFDAFSYLDMRGEERIHFANEFNARLSFGLVAKALCSRFVNSTGEFSGVCELRIHSPKEIGAANADVEVPNQKSDLRLALVPKNSLGYPHVEFRWDSCSEIDLIKVNCSGRHFR